jgi:hypothetical protein
MNILKDISSFYQIDIKHLLFIFFGIILLHMILNKNENDKLEKYSGKFRNFITIFILIPLFLYLLIQRFV